MKEIALALGGGGIKGIAHIGVLKFLERNDYVVRAIAGTSAGGIVGALYSAGYKPAEIEDIISGVKPSDLFAPTYNNDPALLGINGLNQTLNEALGGWQFKDLRMPFACTAVDLISKQEILLHQGNLIDALLATSAVPGIFPPKQIGETILMDGGVLDPVPVSLARWLAPGLPIVAVALSPRSERWASVSSFRMPNSAAIPSVILEQVSRLRIAQAFNIFLKSFDICSLQMTELRLELDQPDVIIRPQVEQYGMLDDVTPQELAQLGETAAQQVERELARALKWPRRVMRRIKRPAGLQGVFLTGNGDAHV